jgi:biotin--protein ligase
MEETFARIMDTFGEMWTTFAEEGQGFEPFFNEYYGRWLHREQQVTLTTTTPHQQVKIHGITRDHGLLRCKVVKEGSRGLTPLYDRGDFGQEDEFVDLQPDGNSFDMMSGLIKRKT